MNETFSPSRAILIAPHTFFLVMLDKLREKKEVGPVQIGFHRE